MSVERSTLRNMPRNFAAAAPGARPATTRHTSVPGPGDAVADAILRARQERQNLTRFTNEHSAAYAAFCGITDRTTAMRLHRGGVDWDAVNAYAKTSIGPLNYDLMVEYTAAGATPADVKAWDAAFTAWGWHPTLGRHPLMFVEAHLAPSDVAPYATSPATQAWDERTIVAAVRRRITPGRAEAYIGAGISRAQDMLTLAGLGARPRYVYEYRRTHPGRLDARAYIRAWSLAHTVAAHRPNLLDVFVTHDVCEADMRAWCATNETDERIGLLVRAGVTHTEWATIPTIRTTEHDVLAAMAALLRPGR